MHTSADCVERHAQGHASGDCAGRGEQTVEHDRAEVVVHVFFDVVVDACHD